MDEITPVISLSFKLGNMINEDSLRTTRVDITGIELISDTGSLLLEPTSMAKLPLSTENISFTSGVPLEGAVTKNESNFTDSSLGEADLSVLSTKDEGLVLTSDPINQELVKVGLFESTETKTPCIDECKVMEFDLGPLALSFLNKDSGESMIEAVTVDDLVLVGKDVEAVVMLDLSKQVSESVFEVSTETKMNKLAFPALWGLVSIQGRRAEMEDSVVVLPRFFILPPQLLSHDHQLSLSDQDLTAHLFGVYDGHGGSQVANYCKERLHVALTEEITKSRLSFNGSYVGYSWKDEWMKIFLNCFQKLDTEVGGSPDSDGDITSDSLGMPPIAPDSVGSTAVVVIVSLNQIIVANCGDSRAVLCRGKVAMPLSTDHKPYREDEFERVEALGGKVINWNGYRVSGVLAVSRSIGDRYLSPYIIPDPEVTFHPRAKEDECLILATDGLWDVMTNEEACDLARRRILLWYKKNGGTLSIDRGEDGDDPAAQDAANYLTHVAFQRGSIDNISVIVVDLKAHRRVKKKV